MSEKVERTASPSEFGLLFGETAFHSIVLDDHVPLFPYQHGQIPLRPLFGSSKCRLIDVPGHQRYITNMIAGASLADAALLLVPADDTFAWSLCSAGGGVPEGARRGMIGTVDS